MVGLDTVAGVVVGAMSGRWQQRLHDGRVGRRPIGDDLDRRAVGRTDSSFEEAVGRGAIPSWRDEHLDDLAELVDCPVDVASPARDLYVGLVDLPAIPNRVPAGPGGVCQQRCEPLDPAVDGGVVDLDAAFGEQLLDVSVRQPKA